MRHDLGITSQIQLGIRQAGVVRLDSRHIRRARLRDSRVAVQLAETQASGDHILLDSLWPYAMPQKPVARQPVARVALLGAALYLLFVGLLVVACLNGVLPPMDASGEVIVGAAQTAVIAQPT